MKFHRGRNKKHKAGVGGVGDKRMSEQISHICNEVIEQSGKDSGLEWA